MKRVLGMACSALTVDDADTGVLELDFLRMSYAVAHLNSAGEDTCGYIVVLRQEIRDVLRRFRARYEVGDNINIVFASLLVSDMTRLSDASEVSQSQDSPGIGEDVAREIAVSSLRREILAREPEVEELTSVLPLPFGVEWDFCGMVRDGSPQSEGGTGLSPRLL